MSVLQNLSAGVIFSPTAENPYKTTTVENKKKNKKVFSQLTFLIKSSHNKNIFTLC